MHYLDDTIAAPDFPIVALAKVTFVLVMGAYVRYLILSKMQGEHREYLLLLSLLLVFFRAAAGMLFLYIASDRDFLLGMLGAILCFGIYIRFGKAYDENEEKEHRMSGNEK